MIINRYPLMIATEDSKFDDRVIKFRNLSLDSARTILMLIGLDRESASALSIIGQYISRGSISCIGGSNHKPSSLPESGTNLNLLIETS